MQCILCGTELDGDSQLCGDCALKAFDKDPLWHCRDFLVGDSVPDVLSRRSIMVLSLGSEMEAFIDARKMMDDVVLPEHPLFEDAERTFWKINMYMNHMGVPLYLEDTAFFQPTIQDLDNISYLLTIARRIMNLSGAASEEVLSRIASAYFFSLQSLVYLRGLSREDMNLLSSRIRTDMETYLSEGEKIMPHRGHIFINQAYLATLEGRYRDALDLYRMVPESESNPRVLTGMARAYEGLEMTETADEHYTGALRENSSWVPAWKGKASVALTGKKWGAALQFISRAIDLRPNDPELHILKGDIFAGQGLHTEADREYQRALTLRHGEKAWLKRSELMYSAGRWGAALQFVERYLFYFPEDENGLRWRERIKEAVDGTGR